MSKILGGSLSILLAGRKDPLQCYIPVMAHRLENSIIKFNWPGDEQRRMVCLTRHFADSFLDFGANLRFLPFSDNGIQRRNVLYMVFSSGRKSFGRERSVEFDDGSVVQVSRDETKTGDGDA